MKFIKKLLIFLLICVLVGTGWMLWFATRPVPLNGTTPAAPLDFIIPPGLSMRGVSQQMAEAGVDFYPWQFTLLARLLGKATLIKAGSYEAAPGVTPLALLDKLTRGDVSQGEVFFVEGATFRQIRAVLDASNDLRHDTRGLAVQEILQRIGAREQHPEGLFFPDTYLFTRQSSDLDILRRAYRGMQQQLDRAWQQRAGGLLLKTPYEALTLASIVEKETGLAQDRALIAAVFLNRLRIGMPLQTDPTVIYGIGPGFNGNLTRRDLRTDSPYNTYLHTGLPPTPIAMPGRAALQATLHPARSDHLYFVARGDGSSAFSRNLDEHNRAVARYQKGK